LSRCPAARGQSSLPKCQRTSSLTISKVPYTSGTASFFCGNRSEPRIARMSLIVCFSAPPTVGAFRHGRAVHAKTAQLPSFWGERQKQLASVEC
jgi:hypothetical protein